MQEMRKPWAYHKKLWHNDMQEMLPGNRPQDWVQEIFIGDMMLNDPLADVMSDINIFENSRKKEVTVPASRLVGNVLRIMQKNNYIGAFEYIDDGKSGKFRIELLGRINRCGVIKPRYASGKDEYEKWEKRFLPARGFGIMVVSTSKGIMSHKEASENKLGGRLLGYVY